jgi:hypothetical protein
VCKEFACKTRFHALSLSPRVSMTPSITLRLKDVEHEAGT